MTNFPSPAKGLKIKRYLDLQNGAANVVKAAPGCLYGLWICNLATTTRYVKVYNRTSATTGTHTPVITLPIPGNSSDDVLAALAAGGVGIRFDTGICISCSTALADNDNTAPTAGDVVAHVFYI